jgi:hypothetical protein
MRQIRTQYKEALLVGLLISALSGLAQAQTDGQALAINVAQPANGSLHILGVTATQVGEAVVIAGRVSRDLRARLVGANRLIVELRAADGSVRASEGVSLSASDLPRRSSRDARFKIQLNNVPASDESLVLVMNPRRG